MRKILIWWLAIFLSTSCLVGPGPDQAVRMTVGKASQSRILDYELQQYAPYAEAQAKAAAEAEILSAKVLQQQLERSQARQLAARTAKARPARAASSPRPQAARAPANVPANAALGQSLATARGWSGNEWDCLYALWQSESGWSQYADNPRSSAYGIPQALPGSKMATAGADWQHNAETQIRWGLGYIASRYGTPCKAWQHKKARNWY